MEAQMCAEHIWAEPSTWPRDGEASPLHQDLSVSWGGETQPAGRAAQGIYKILKTDDQVGVPVMSPRLAKGQLTCEEPITGRQSKVGVQVHQGHPLSRVSPETIIYETTNTKQVHFGFGLVLTARESAA